jgi:fluoride exporter
MHTLLVGAGGFCGAVLRFTLGGIVHRALPATAFPYGTIAVNLLGCFAIGWLMGLGESRQLFGPALRGFLFVGLLGGFTTFSTFGYETFALLRDQAMFSALVSVSVQLVVGIALVAAGYTLGMGR